jgi:molybdopterin molybdotransferase
MPPPLSVDEALARILDGVAPMPAEDVAIEAAHRRTLADRLAALITQPPFDASAMDGYAVRAADVARLPVTLDVIGEAAAGHPFAGAVAAGQAVRILTGAPLPAGADAVVIQENTERDGARVIVREGTPDRGHVRHTGFDFRAGEILLQAGRRLGPREVALAAAMGHGTVPVHRTPRVAVISTGDELVAPGSRPGPGQIISSNHLGVAALAEAAGAKAELLGIARDTRESLEAHFARAEGADVIVTIGGASVGDHDLVGPVLEARGMALSFWRIAMRPGQPLMFGRLGPARVMGLPGNPVSSLVCTRVFLVPLLRALLGQPARDERPVQASAGVALEANGPRQHYMRATTTTGPQGLSVVTPVRSQDSSLLAPLAQADCLLVRPPHAPAAPQGALVPILPLDF